MRVTRMRRRLFALTAGCLCLGLVLLLVIFQSPIFQPADMDISCYKELDTGDDSLPRFDEGTDGPRLSSGRNVFFHETSCFADGQAKLKCRQACAVESAALANPSLSVSLLFLSPSPPCNHTRRLIERLLSYDNVRVYRLFVDDYMRDTPLEKWYADGVLETSYWPRSHMSDVMRYLSLWKFGGIYLDLDVVVTKSLEDLSDFSGAEDHLDVAAGVIGFSRSSLGRRMADASLRDLVRNFRGDVWGNNGPGVITRVLRKLCNVEHITDMSPERCEGFKVFPPSAFYPVYFNEWQRYFSLVHANETMQMIEKARAIHVWNKLSGQEPLRVGSQVPYAVIAQQHCPRVYAGCGDNF